MDYIAGSDLAYANQTVLHPFGILILCVAVLLTLTLPRRYCILPLVVVLACIPGAQRITLLTLDFNFVRIVVLIGLLRALFSGDAKNLQHNTTDKLAITYAVWGVLAYGLLFTSLSAFVTRTGYMIEAVGAFFLARIYIKNWSNIQHICITLAVVSAPLAYMFLVEKETGRNLFHIFGGIPEFTLVREGEIRAQGPFPHPIMAGVFWGSCVPWFLISALNTTNPKPAIALIGCFCSLIIVYTTASSTPVLLVGFTLIAALAFKLRYKMREIRIGIVLTIIGLQLTMNAPVWHLLSRINVFGGSTGWHRYHLIDKTISNFTDWFVVGTRGTAHWGRGLGDVTNQIILEGVRGGLLGMILFVALIACTFSVIGTKLKTVAKPIEQFMYWLTGAYVFATLASFFAVSYFGQATSFFFLLIGAIQSICTLDKNPPELVQNPVVHTKSGQIPHRPNYLD